MSWYDVGAVRTRMGSALFGMVAGPEGPTNRARIHGTPGPRWFDEDRPIRRVHADASMFVGGLRALLLQSLHPLAMAGVAEHSDYRGDPWGRLARLPAGVKGVSSSLLDHYGSRWVRIGDMSRHVRTLAPIGCRQDLPRGHARPSTQPRPHA